MSLLLFFNQSYVVPASETEEGKKRLQAYYEALGRFIDMFARVETAVTLTLWHYARTIPEIAKVIFAGAKIEISSKYIKQLSLATNAADAIKLDLENVLQQLGIINGVRNAILHYGAESVAEGQAIVSNALRAKGEPNVFPISPTALEEMTADLRKIAAHLEYRHLARSKPTDVSGNQPIDEVLRSPWRYKYPEQPKKRATTEEDQRPKKRDPKPPLQPRSSRE